VIVRSPQGGGSFPAIDLRGGSSCSELRPHNSRPASRDRAATHMLRWGLAVAPAQGEVVLTLCLGDPSERVHCGGCTRSSKSREVALQILERKSKGAVELTCPQERFGSSPQPTGGFKAVF
jgi:hypothetical protein